jgi:glycosyltransferase involved in cell wall biosynthesis
MTVHVLTGEYGPGAGGVGAYTQVLVEALKQRGLRSIVWNTLDPAIRQALPAGLKSHPGYVLLQYVPNALGARGGNIAFCQWLLGLRRAGIDVRVMFHEPYFYLSWNPALNALAMVQRLMAGILLRASSHTYIATEQWRRYLAPYAPPGTHFTVLPIPSTLPDEPSPQQVNEWRRRFAPNGEPTVVHFGTYGDHVVRELAPIVPALFQCLEPLRFVCVGRGGEGFVRRMVRENPTLADRLRATGPLEPMAAAAAIAAGDVVLQPYPDGVTTRRTSVMAALAVGAPTVTSRGMLTEAVWTEVPSVALATASDSAGHVAAVASLLRDEPTRTQLGGLGRRLYRDRFSVERTVDILAADLMPAR